MACGYCRTTPIDPANPELKNCPVCDINYTMTPRNMRKGPKQAPRLKPQPVIQTTKAPGAPVWTIRAQPPVPLTQRPIVAQRVVSAHRAVLSVCCDDCEAVFPAARSIPSGMVRLDSGKLVCESCAAKQAKRAGLVIGWFEAAKLTIDTLRRPKALQADAVITEKTLAPVARNDWAGLGRAVEAGILSHSQAVELAASWKGVAV